MRRAWLQYIACRRARGVQYIAELIGRHYLSGVTSRVTLGSMENPTRGRFLDGLLAASVLSLVFWAVFAVLFFAVVPQGATW